MTILFERDRQLARDYYPIADLLRQQLTDADIFRKHLQGQITKSLKQLADDTHCTALKGLLKDVLSIPSFKAE
jgi:hypothetical protein